jgi:hypothetical protein
MQQGKYIYDLGQITQNFCLYSLENTKENNALYS